MNKITFPLKQSMQGRQVANLQEALQSCLDRGALVANDDRTRRELVAALKLERPEQTYGAATKKLVRLFQEEKHLDTSGEVDQPTANALNALLKKWGLLEPTERSSSCVVSGAVQREDGLLLGGVHARAFHQTGRGAIRLGEDTTDAQGRYTIRYELLPGVDAINLGVSAVDEDGTTLGSSPVIKDASPLETIDLTVPLAAASADQERIEGTIMWEHGLPAEKLNLRLYRRDFGGKLTKLDDKITLAGGRYAFAYDVGSAVASLEVHAVKADDTEIPLSRPLNELTPEARAGLNLVAPGSLQPSPAKSEYRRLAEALKPHVGQIAKLATAKENAEQQDITVLNRATGWDARLIALASIGERLAADTDVKQAKLPSETLYALLRAGLPSDKLLLAQVEPDVVGMALKKVRDARIVDLTDEQITDFKTKFEGFANTTRLELPAPGSRSTYGALLRSSGLKKAERDKFAQIYLKHRGNGDQLWQEARESGLDETHIATLQLQGKLAFLAGNSEEITSWLRDEVKVKDPVELVKQDFHQADKWENRIRAAVNDDPKKLAAWIPVAYRGENVDARLEAYAQDMARKVRLSYPTQVLGKLIAANNKDNRYRTLADKASVDLLQSSAATGFRLGQTPVDAYFKTRMSDDEFKKAQPQLLQLKKLQRMYQITPSNEAMPVLDELKMTSAFDVMAYSTEQFRALFEAMYQNLHKKPAPAGEAELVRRKATQVSSVTYNLFTIAKKLESDVPLAGMSAPLEVRESELNSAREALIKHYPTMESLFGSMDFCECEHCRSVLSPAAYLVDLLQFVDTESGVWANFLAGWEQNHNNEEYQAGWTKKPDGTQRTKDERKPYDVLIERRPDLPHIALTCENTGTALPYIDIVNEILEYYVANGKLEKEAAHDTGEATTAELLAEPQHVIRKAYDSLREARYPLHLPFDLWIETVRQFCNYVETPLHRVLEVLRPGDDATARIQDPTNTDNATLTVSNADAVKLRERLACTYLDVSNKALATEAKIISAIGDADSGGSGRTRITFEGTWGTAPDAEDLLFSDGLGDRAPIAMESLGLSPAEVAIFTDADPLANDKWHELYGYPSVRTAIESPTNVGDATLSVADADAGKLKEGLACTYFGKRNNTLSGEARIIASIGAPNSGGAGRKTITFAGAWATKPEAGDDLVCAVPQMLSSAKALSRRLGVTYKEITEIVQTGFVNPELTKLRLLYKLGVAIQDARLYVDGDCRKLHADKKELLALLKNKNRTELPLDDQLKLRDLSIEYKKTKKSEWEIVNEVAAFEQRLTEVGTAFGMSLADLQAEIERIPFAETLELADPDAGCNFDLTKLQYADGREADPIAFLRINLFVRLWRKLGWSIEETDRALCTFIPKSTPFDGQPANLAKQPLRAALIYTAHLKTLDEKVSVGKQSRLKLLTLWSDIATTGKNPLYAQLFLTRSALKTDAVFDHPLGDYLSAFSVEKKDIEEADKLHPNTFQADQKVSVAYEKGDNGDKGVQRLTYKGFLDDAEKAKIKALLSGSDLLAFLLDEVQAASRISRHLPALQGALGLTADEISRILVDADKSADTAELSLRNVSLLYRYGLLARALKLTVREMIVLKQLSGLDPFKDLHSDPLKTLDQDHPFSQTLAFVKVAEEIKESGLKIEDLDYLLRHRFDDTGKYRPDHSGTLAFLKSLSAGVRAIRAEHAVPDDPGALSDEVLRQKLGLVLPAEVAETFMAMMNGTAEFTATVAGVKPGGELPSEGFAEELSIDHVEYTSSTKEQKLTYRGVLSDKEKAATNARFASLLTSPQRSTLEALLDGVQQEALEKVTDDFTATTDNVASGNALPSSVFTTETAISNVQYDDATKKQRLTYHGVLFDTEKSRLKAKFESMLTPSQSSTLAMLLDDVQQQALKDDTTEFTATKAGVQPGSELPSTGFAEAPAIVRVTFDPVRQKQKLTYRGVPFDKESGALEKKFAPLLTELQRSTFKALLHKLVSKEEPEQARSFFNTYLLKQADTKPESGFLNKSDYDLLFEPAPTGLTEPGQQARERKRRTRLANAFLPFLQQRLIRQFIVQTITAQTGADPSIVESLVTDDRLLASPDDGSLLDAFTQAGDRGLTATYWFSKDRSGVALTVPLGSWDGSSQVTTATPIRHTGNGAELAGHLAVPEDGDYTFFVKLARKGDKVRLCIEDSTIEDSTTPLLEKVAPKDSHEFPTRPKTLEKGKRYWIQLFASSNDPSQVHLTVESATLPKSGYETRRLDGYLEVPIGGSYRFNIELDEEGAAAELRFPHRPESLFLKGKAGADDRTLGKQPEELLELEAGVPYRFALDLTDLNGGEARLLVQGETLPKGPMSQLTLYPASAMDSAERAMTLLNKALQIVQSLGLSDREIRYLLTDGAGEFDHLEFNTLPWRDAQDALNTIAEDKMGADSSLKKEGAIAQARGENPELASEADQAALVTTHFKQFRRLAAYARLKRDLAGGTDDLIDIFEANATAAADRLEKQVYPLIAKVTRREEAVVKATAAALFAAPAFASEKPLQRLWEALQVVERFGVPPASLAKWVGIANCGTAGEPPFEIARDLKDAIKARFEPETWQRVAQPIFDKLRQRQRDALVAHVMHQHDFDRIEQLYEHFLIDPGMEPVVQTSRIRLAIASVQLFIQRCLLNLEPKVHPSPTIINSKQWEWMKRYRVWEANRKIFLFPENWLEPEFRDDKTHLFSELEGALLQGDVSSDLVEDAFLNYLKKLDELARLDICAMHMEDNEDPASRILHVFGRTFSQPHQYFYRRYAHQMWSPWEPVSAEIEGDHLAPVVWRDRLYLFWVTFLDKADSNPERDPATGSKKLTDVTLSEIVTDLNSVVANKQIDVHLHWSEYLRGEWSTRESGGFSPLISVTVAASFVPSSVFIHVSKEDAADGAERGVFINLGGEVNRGFYLAGRNSAPESASYWSTPANPFNSANTALATRYSGSGELKVIYGERISNEPGKTPPKANPSVLQGSLQSGGSYTILPCNLGISREAFRQPHRVVEDFGYDAGGWRVDKHPRFLADLTGDGRADIVGFANDGVCVALNNGDGTFQAPKWVVKNDFGYGSGAGGWRVDKHPRFLADLTGDGRADIVGFGDDGVYVTLNKGDGTFRVPKQVVRNNFGYGSGAGGWRVDKHPRFLADLTGDGRADIVGFGDDGVYVALNKGDGTFRVPKQVVRNNFGYGSGAGGWRVENHPRFLADLTGDGRADIVGFGDDGVYVALNNGNGTFQAPSLVVQNFGHVAGVWRVENHPRFLADLTGNGCADIVGFANAGVYVALNKGDGTFEEPRRVVEDFGYAGGWRVEDHPRFLADLTGDGRADIVGFANAGVYVALNNGDGTFQAPRRVVEDFGYDTGGWCAEMHPRCVADLTGAGGADIVGFANEGVCVALNDGALDSRVNEIASLVKPVFYQDNQHSFFVEPEVVEQTIDEWDEWVTRTTQLEPRWKVPTISIITAIPHAWAIRGQGDPWVVPIDPRSLINSPLDRDWLLNPSSAMTFNNVLIGPKGQAGIEIQFAGDLAVGRRLANANPGGNLTAGSSVVLRDEKSFASSGLRAVGGGLNIVGSAGFSSALEQNFNNLKRFDFGAGAPLSARRNTR